MTRINDPIHFINHTDQIEAFRRLQADDQRWVLVYYGLSGNGKTHLMDYLIQNECRSQNMAHSRIDLDLEDIRADYTLLLARIVDHEGFISHLDPGARQCLHDELHATQCELLRQRGARPDASRRIIQIAVGSRDTTQIVNFGPSSSARTADEIARTASTMKWLDCISTLGELPVIIFLDAYDMFPQSGNESWFWGALLLARQRMSGLRVVIATANKSHLLPEGVASLVAVEALTSDDSTKLLHNLGIYDDSYAEKVYNEFAEGNPLLTTLAADAWRVDSPNVPDVARFPEKDDVIDWVLSRIIKRLEDPIKDVVRWVPILRQFNLESIAAICGIYLSDEEYSRLIHCAFVTRRDSSPTIHNTVRRVQFKYLAAQRADEFQNRHRLAAAYYYKRGQSIESLYHQFFVDLNAAFEEWSLDEKTAFQRAEYIRAGELLDLVESPEIPLTERMAALVSGRRGGWLQHYRSDYPSAIEYYRRAAGELERLTGESSETAEALDDLALVLHESGDMDTPRALYMRALDIFERLFGPENCKVGQALNNMGYYLHNAGDYDAARPLLERAVNVWTACLGRDHPDTLSAISDLALLKEGPGGKRGHEE